MLPHDALVVVADDRSALLYRNTSRRGVYLVEVARITLDGLGGPVRSPSALSGTKDSDPDGFARRLADHLNAMAIRNGFEDIAIVAAPAILRTLRRHYHKELQFRLRREIERNLTDADVRDVSAVLI